MPSENLRPALKCKTCGYEGNEDHECISPDGFYTILRPVVVYELLALENGLTAAEIL